MLKKCEYCNERVRFWALHNRECKKRRSFLKLQNKSPFEVVTAEVMNTPNIKEIEIEQKPKRQYTKKVKP